MKTKRQVATMADFQPEVQHKNPFLEEAERARWEDIGVPSFPKVEDVGKRSLTVVIEKVAFDSSLYTREYVGKYRVFFTYYLYKDPTGQYKRYTFEGGSMAPAVFFALRKYSISKFRGLRCVFEVVQSTKHDDRAYIAVVTV